MTAELQLQRATVDFENRKLTMEKNTAEYTRERDSEVLALKKGAEGEQKRYDAAKEQLTAQIKQLEANLRRANRKTVELETSLGAKLQEEAKLTSDNDKLNARINSLTENYRAKLMEYINEEGGEGEEEQAQLREELIGTYRKKEVELQQNIEEYRNRNHDLVKKNRGMFDKYRELKYVRYPGHRRLYDRTPLTIAVCGSSLPGTATTRARRARGARSRRTAATRAGAPRTCCARCRSRAWTRTRPTRTSRTCSTSTPTRSSTRSRRPWRIARRPRAATAAGGASWAARSTFATPRTWPTSRR